MMSEVRNEVSSGRLFVMEEGGVMLSQSLHSSSNPTLVPFFKASRPHNNVQVRVM